MLLRPKSFQNEVSDRDIADDPLVARESVVPDSRSCRLTKVSLEMCLEFLIRCGLIGIGCPEELQFSESAVYARLKVKAEPMGKSGKRCAFDCVVSLRNVPQLRPHQCGEFGFVNTPRNVYTWCDKSEVGTYIQASND